MLENLQLPVEVSRSSRYTDRTLLGVADTPARLADGSPMPAPLARALVLDSDTAKRVRRLFTDRAGRLVTAETNSATS